MAKWLVAKYFAVAGAAILVFSRSFWTNHKSYRHGNLSVISTELLFCCHYTKTQSAYKTQIYCGRHFSGNLSSLAVGNIIKKYVFVIFFFLLAGVCSIIQVFRRNRHRLRASARQRWQRLRRALDLSPTPLAAPSASPRFVANGRWWCWWYSADWARCIPIKVSP